MRTSPAALLTTLAWVALAHAGGPPGPLVDIKAALAAKDTPDPLIKKSPHRVHEVKLEAGKSYVIDLKSGDFDPFLRLEDAAGKHLADDDDSGGGLNARLVFTPKQAGVYRVIVTAYPRGKTHGAYHLTVTAQAPGEALRVRALDESAAGARHYQAGEFDESAGRYREAVRLWRELYPGKTHPDGHPDLATGLNNLAMSLTAGGRHEEARGHFEQALAMFRKTLPAGHPLIAQTLDNLGVALVRLSRPDDGRARHEESAALLEKMRPLDLTLLARNQSHLGDALCDLGRLDEARARHERAVALFEKTTPPGPVELAIALDKLGTALHLQGRFADARAHHERARALYEKTLPPGHRFLASNLHHLGLVLRDEGKLGAAREHFARAAAILERAFPRGHSDLAGPLTALASVLIQQHRLDEARTALNRVLTLQKSLPGGHHYHARALNELGMLLRAEGRLGEARAHLERALTVCEKALPADHPDLAQTITNLANALGAQGRLDQARALHERAVALRRRSLPPGHPDVARGLINLAGVLDEQGRQAEARARLEEALTILSKALPGDHPDIASCRDSLGAVLRGLGRAEEARDQIERALAIYKKALPADHPDLALSHNSLGTLHWDAGRLAEARSQFEIALTIYRKGGLSRHADAALALSNLGMVLLDQGRADEARTHLQEAVAIYRESLPPAHPLLANGLSTLGSALRRLGRHEEAFAALASGAETSVRHAALVALGSTEADHGALFADARAYLEQLLSAAPSPALTGPQREQLLARALDGRALSTAALLQRRQVLLEQADEAAHTAAARLAERRQRLADLMLYGASREARAAHHRQCLELVREVDDLERDLAGRVQPFADLLQARRADPKAVAARLPAGGVLIEIFRHRVWKFGAPRAGGAPRWGPERYAALLLWRGADGGPQTGFVALGDAAPLDRAVAAWRADVQRGKPGAGPGPVLRELLWEPLAKALPEKATRLLIAPDGQLALVPFEAIPLAGGEYLIERYTVSYVTGGRDLLLGPGAGAGKGRAVLLADPAYNASGGPPGKEEKTDEGGLRFRSLPGFGREADAATKLLGGREATSLRGAAASEEALAKATRPRLLYLITHGFFLEDVRGREERGGKRDLAVVSSGGARLPDVTRDARLRSGLALAGANRWQERSAKGLSDGLLTALEVEGLDLWGTELVILSACDTGRGEVQVGEGVLGLRRAFQLAGAQTVLASLWQVPDAETEQLMTDTLSRWLKGMPPQEALREAQLAMIRRLRAEAPRDAARGLAPPLYWAAFICHGRP